ncbi:MAG: aldehyde ferredoxin oxidoreductase C-terminal domain-containing protein, partial [Anaerolineae bacterium]|nr:aldehyde ferredoxin oxidoreductase C-terminal domain-containing protein [Anaerolineae bacterium]
ERLMLAQSGRGRSLEMGMASHFNLPCRADGTRIDKEGFAELVDEYYAARDWDLEHGWPTPHLLSRLGLESVVPDAEEYRPLDWP